MKLILSILIVTTLSVSCAKSGGDETSGSPAASAANDAQWARVPSVGANVSYFNATTVDSSGNILAAGYQRGTTSYTYGTGVTATGAYATDNAVVVKFNSSGVAQWARSTTTAPNVSAFQAVAIDSSGNVYAAGYQYGSGTYTYGTGVTATATYASGNNIILVKYDSTGTALWARTVTAGTTYSLFNGLAVDSSNNVYAAGIQGFPTAVTYLTGISVTGPYASGQNAVLVKYDTSGTAQWARGPTSASNTSTFSGVCIDSGGNPVVAGEIYGNAAVTLDTGVTATGVWGGAESPLVVKYSNAGTATWARSVNASGGSTRFYGVACDSSGNIYAAGSQGTTTVATYDTGITATGAASTNAIVVKYNSTGTAQWARTSTTGTTQSTFYAVAVDSAANVYTAGLQSGSTTYTYGTGVTATATYGASNTIAVKYDTSGAAGWARTVTGGSNNANFTGVAANSAGVYAVGHQRGTTTFTYSGVSATGTYASSSNALIVGYNK